MSLNHLSGAEPVRESEVSAALGNINFEITELDQRIHVLAERVNPALRQEPSVKPTEATEKIQEMQSPLGASLNSQSANIRSIRYRIEDILRRIEL
jgi:hypothetical protein